MMFRNRLNCNVILIETKLSVLLQNNLDFSFRRTEVKLALEACFVAAKLHR